MSYKEDLNKAEKSINIEETLRKLVSDIQRLENGEEILNQTEKSINIEENSGKLVSDIQRLEDDEETLNQAEKSINIEEISRKLVSDIQRLEDDEETSISTLLNKEIDFTSMHDIYDLLIKKLEEVGLYLDFMEHENERTNFPFNIPFKKGYIQTITILGRFYNGDFGKGSVYTDEVKINLIGKHATVTNIVRFCIDEKIHVQPSLWASVPSIATLECSIPFVLEEKDIIKMKDIIKKIKDKAHGFKSINSLSNYLVYNDLTINGTYYEVDSKSEELLELKKLFKCNLGKQALHKSYDFLINVK